MCIGIVVPFHASIHFYKVHSSAAISFPTITIMYRHALLPMVDTILRSNLGPDSVHQKLQVKFSIYFVSDRLHPRRLWLAVMEQHIQFDPSDHPHRRCSYCSHAIAHNQLLTLSPSLSQPVDRETCPRLTPPYQAPMEGALVFLLSYAEDYND